MIKETTIKKAKWQNDYDTNSFTSFKCSNCGNEPLYQPNRHSKRAYITLTPYCPMCGCEMEFEEEET